MAGGARENSKKLFFLLQQPRAYKQSAPKHSMYIRIQAASGG